jgi:hypothetical protein
MPSGPAINMGIAIDRERKRRLADSLTTAAQRPGHAGSASQQASAQQERKAG